MVLPACKKTVTEVRKNSVVKVFTSAQTIDFYEPWKPGSQYSLEGCGCIIAGAPFGDARNRVLTVSRMVNRANYIEVQRFGETKRYVAKVEQVGFDLDLAVLSVADAAFFKGTEPVELGDLPAAGDKVTAHGGDEKSVKEDTVSGLDQVWCVEAGRYVPAILTNDSVESDSYGCPVFKGRKLIGIAFNAYTKPEKAGAVVPANMIRRFFKGFKDNRPYDGFPDLGIAAQSLENAALRDYYRVPAVTTGVIITKVGQGSTADGPLKEGDVLTAINGRNLDNEGKINVGKLGRIDGDYLIFPLMMGENVKLDVLRDGGAVKVEAPLKPISRLVTYRADERKPTFFMIAGFVFAPLTGNYFGTAQWKSFNPKLQDLYYNGTPTKDRKEVVLVSHVLPNDINEGYDKLNNLIVEKVNGKPVPDMKALVAAFAQPMGRYHVVETDDHAYFGSMIVFDAKKAEKATKEIMAAYKIPADRSDDLK
jgi:S1-C subfamily serine protease